MKEQINNISFEEKERAINMAIIENLSKNKFVKFNETDKKDENKELLLLKLSNTTAPINQLKLLINIVGRGEQQNYGIKKIVIDTIKKDIPENIRNEVDEDKIWSRLTEVVEETLKNIKEDNN